MVVNYNTPLSIMNIATRQKINKRLQQHYKLTRSNQTSIKYPKT